MTSEMIDHENTDTHEFCEGSWRSVTAQGVQSLVHSKSKNPTVHAKNIREQYRNYFNGTGKVAWQNEAIQ